MILEGDALDRLKELADKSVDTIITDPPYGYSFMGKDWDKAVPSVEIWQQCLRVLKSGAFMCVMSAPRSDVQNAMISRLMEAGFRLDFTPIYWTYASGFPKAGNIGKLVDKRMGAEREVVGTRPRFPDGGRGAKSGTIPHYSGQMIEHGAEVPVTAPATDQAKALDGSYAGFQPKPAVEVILVAMKPLSEKTYVDQALANGHGVSWLDDARIPTDSDTTRPQGSMPQPMDWDSKGAITTGGGTGRFPANLLVCDDVLNDGVERKSGWKNTDTQKSKSMFLGEMNETGQHYADNGSYSRYFDLDKWASTLPFLITPKASKSEKNKGLDGKPETEGAISRSEMGMVRWPDGTLKPRKTPQPTRANHHPTVKPLKLMSYLITLFSRPGDTVLDPFVGSGTTVVAAKQLGRDGIGIEREAEYAEIARARVAHIEPSPRLQAVEHNPEKIEELKETLNVVHEQMRLI